MDVQGLSPFHGVVRELMSTDSVRMVVGLAIELGIALDGLKYPHQKEHRHSWTESTHAIVMAHTQPSQPRRDSPSHRLPDNGMHDPEDACQAPLAYEDLSP